jgi:murein DD-endopeptidase MepM/ murein hydrolase activator NlpD
MVKKGEVIGRTGDTGLAGGDHLHFSTMLYGVHVDPVEWWDGKWLQDHVQTKLPPPSDSALAGLE